MKHSHVENTKRYYDGFAATYENERHHGYHQLIDELELDLVRRYGAGRDVFEAGCGTGLLLRQAAAVARTAVGLDLSRGMLKAAQQRELRVIQGSLTNVPLPGESVDLVYSMKVLPHVAPIEQALSELARLLRPGGYALFEFYNPRSLRFLAKRLAGPLPITTGTTERDVFTRWDTLADARRYLPASLEVVAVRGVRVLTPTSQLFRYPLVARALTAAEKAACDLPLVRRLGGFLILVARKNG